MRRRGSKTAAIYREWTPIRLAFLRENPRCCVCGGMACDVHEILAGSHRMAAFTERCCWLRTCRTCHDWLQGIGKPEQLALKLLSDPSYYDREKVCEIWGRPPTAITAGEVLEELRSLLIERAA